MIETIIGIYIRLSNDDGDKMESDSIGNQRKYLNSYITQNLSDAIIYDEYVDDGYTGTNFDRPSFKRMYDDASKGKINCIIVKDLSRFGRDYLDVGRYLQKIFPQMGIRFIAINDHVDSLQQAYDIMMPMKNIFNEQYSRDISSKIKSTFDIKRKEGKFIGAFPSYGYLKDENDKNKLVVDEYAANIVRKIFKLYIEGYGKISIATVLNKEGILCPSEYKKSMGYHYCNSNKYNQTVYWTYSSIHHILTNELYIGNMVQGRCDCSKYRNTKSRTISKENYIVVDNTHEPIIDIETWKLTQGLLQRKTKTLPLKNNVSKYAGFLFCSDCGRAMSKISSPNKKTYYVCGSYKRYTKMVCSRHGIEEETLDSILLTDLNNVLSSVHHLKEYVSQIAKEGIKKESEKQSTKNVSQVQIQLDKIKKLKKGLYEDYKSELITKDEYFGYKKDYEEQEKNLSSIINSYNETETPENRLLNDTFITKLLKYKSIQAIDRRVLESFYKKIIIGENKELTIVYKFDYLYNDLMNVKS